MGPEGIRRPAGPSGRPGDATQGLFAGAPIGAVLWLTGVALWATRIPFLPRAEPWEVTLTPPTAVPEVIGNVLLLAPLALLLSRAVRGQGGGRERQLGLWAILAAGCFVLEAGQVFVEGRVVSPWDLGLNLAGASLGQWLGLRIGAEGERRTGRALRVVAGLLVAAWAGISLFLLNRAREGSGGFRLEGWEPGYRIVAGDEVGGDRAYLGTVEWARICAGRSPDRLCATDGADDRTRRRLARAAEETQSVVLEARVRSSSSQHRGPTRIVTFSAGPGLRNATLAQSGDDLVLRVRTPLSGPNGTAFTFRLPDAVPVGEEIPVVASFRDGTVRLSAGEGGVRGETTFRMTERWLYTRVVAGSVDPAHRRQPAWAALAGLAVVLFPAGLVAGWTASPRGRGPSLAAGAAAGVVVLTAYAVALDLVPDPAVFLAAAGAGALGSVVGRRDRKVWWSRYTWWPGSRSDPSDGGEIPTMPGD